jgi:hypothetical protein
VKKTDENCKQIIDGATGAVIDTSQSGKLIKLSDLRDVRLELAAVYRKMKAGDMKTQDGTRMAFVLKTIADVIVSADLERRMPTLRKRVNGNWSLHALASTLPYRFSTEESTPCVTLNGDLQNWSKSASRK